MNTEYKRWLTQFRKGYIELLMLLLLNSHEKLHGLALLNELNSMQLDINEGTLYPLLNRMEHNKWLYSSWAIPKNNGHPRREYSINDDGRKLLPKLIQTFNLYDDAIKILQERQQ